MSKWNVMEFSSIYNVRKMSESDLSQICRLMGENEQYYQYCGKSYSMEDVKNDLYTTPPGKTREDKYYVGFFDGEILTAVMDLIDGYPQDTIAFIGFFMMNKAYQGCGKGTEIIREICEFLKQKGMQKVRLGIDKENPQSNHFWKKNGFHSIYEVEQDAGTIVVAERMLEM